MSFFVAVIALLGLDVVFSGSVEDTAKKTRAEVDQ